MDRGGPAGCCSPTDRIHSLSLPIAWSASEAQGARESQFHEVVTTRTVTLNATADECIEP